MFRLVFHPNPMGICISAMPKPLSSILVLAEAFGGVCNLRYDDTNPVKEDVEFVDAIKEDIHWLGFHWENEFYASDYFDQLYDLALS